MLPLQFFIQFGAEIADFIPLIFLLFKFLLDFLQFLRKTLYALFEFLNLTPSSEQVACLFRNEPPVMEPPGLKSSPSRVTMRSV